MPPIDIDALVDAMTLGEQVSLLSGRDFWTTVPVARLGVPSLKVSDGPNGARGGGALVGGIKAAAFPVGIALGATWNPQLVSEVGCALAHEARSKGALALLAPTVNLHRSTLNGRNFECYSEDPHLTAELAVAYIRGLQGAGVGATIKHFVGNESEYQRQTISSDIDERSLRELYYVPFEAAVKRAQVKAIMTGYNRLNGTYVSEQADLLQGLVRGEWGFDGLFMSDWFGTKATAAALMAGLDLEMPGPGRYRGEKLLEALDKGEVSAGAVRRAARQVLKFIEGLGGFAEREPGPEIADDRPATRALIRRAGAEAAVLLKNDAILPLSIKPGMKIAVIGPNAAVAQIMGGGSAQINPHYAISPLAGLTEALAPEAEIIHARGCDNYRLLPLVSTIATAEFFEGRKFAGAPRHRRPVEQGLLMLMGEGDIGLKAPDFSVRITTSAGVTQSGRHEFSIVASGPARLFVNDHLLVDALDFVRGDEFFGTCCNELRGSLDLAAGSTCEIVAELVPVDGRQELDLTVLRLGMAYVTGARERDAAVAAAREADVALVFAGLSADWDSEGIDRPNLDLPGGQNELIAAVAAANTHTVVVLQSGCPVTMPWLDAVKGLVQAWYPGQEAGHAIADVLLGHAEPGGRLPQTFPQRLEDDPAFLNYPGEAGHVRYGEGIFIGYRFYEKRAIKPLFPFGFGLSYTRFEMGSLSVQWTSTGAGRRLEAMLTLRNAGQRAGSSVVQFYVSDKAASVARPHQELKAFRKVALAAGETREIKVNLDLRALAFYDVTVGKWRAEAGAFTLRAGFSSADIAAEATFTLDEGALI
ncbi:MAG: glycoside hydrolase family 3 C-terminal domain-containing protein [Hyphomicrobiales bacterium]|nr:glycoside hydrolase family 3 C-terminal domain-containing protein [Hyphomicrobiales bacterium]